MNVASSSLRTILITVAGIGTLLFATLAGVHRFEIDQKSEYWSVKQIEDRIQAEIPQGCGREEIEAWFDKQKVSHHFTRLIDYDLLQPTTVSQLAGVDSENLNGMLRGHVDAAVLPDDSEQFCTIYFLFDESNQCVGHAICPHNYHRVVSVNFERSNL